MWEGTCRRGHRRIMWDGHIGEYIHVQSGGGGWGKGEGPEVGPIYIIFYKFSSACGKAKC